MDDYNEKLSILINEYTNKVRQLQPVETEYKEKTKNLINEINVLKKQIKTIVVESANFKKVDNAKQTMQCDDLKILIIKKTTKIVEWDDIQTLNLLKKLGVSDSEIAEIRKVKKIEKVDLRKSFIKNKEVKYE